MVRIKMFCFEPDQITTSIETPPHSDYASMDEAYKAALDMAEREVDELNDGADDGVSFGIVEDEDLKYIRVLYYYNESPYDTTGNTAQVTVYYFENDEEDL